MGRFTESDDDVLIEMVSQNPILFDASHPNYKNMLIRENAWKNIGEILHKSGEECKKRWKVLRDSYFRRKKKNKLSTGSAECYKEKWHLFGRLQFLNNVLLERATVSNINDEEVVEIQSSELTAPSAASSESPLLSAESQTLWSQQTHHSSQMEQSSQQVQAQQLPRLRRKRKTTNSHDEIISLLKKREEQRQLLEYEKYSGAKNSPIRTFSQHVEAVLESLPKPLMIQAKNEIFHILTKYEASAANSTTSANIEQRNSTISTAQTSELECNSVEEDDSSALI